MIQLAIILVVLRRFLPFVPCQGEGYDGQSISGMGIQSESSESEASSTVALCDPRFRLERLERRARLALDIIPMGC